MNQNEKPIVLTIAGSDPSGGAGIQADIRAFESVGVFGMSVITALTVQTASQVISWEAVDASLVKKQLFSLLEHYPISHVKTGMLPSSEIIDVIVEAKEKWGFTLIVDPILVSTSGLNLGEENLKVAFVEKLLPKTDILIPNAEEVVALLDSNMDLQAVSGILKAGELFTNMGVKKIIFKGGHITGENSGLIIDYYYEDGGLEMYPHERIDGATNTHGTGCIFSSLFTGNLALVQDEIYALELTEDQIEYSFRNIFQIPTVNGEKTDSVLDMGYSSVQIALLNDVKRVYEYFRSKSLFSKLVAEVRANISICQDGAKTKEQVAAIEGRITVINGVPTAYGPIKFGVSNHTARLILSAHKKDPTIHAVMNLRYHPDYIQALIEEEFTLFEINREAQANKVEDNTMQWVINESYKALNKIPDIIWDCGEPEKEPMLRLFAKDAKDLIDKLVGIHRAIKKLEAN